MSNGAGWVLTGLFVGSLTLGTYVSITEPEDIIVKSGSVLKSGCVGHNTRFGVQYDCSVDIEWETGEVTREVVRFGALPGDEVNHIKSPKQVMNGRMAAVYRFERKEKL